MLASARYIAAGFFLGVITCGGVFYLLKESDRSSNAEFSTNSSANGLYEKKSVQIDPGLNTRFPANINAPKGDQKNQKEEKSPPDAVTATNPIIPRLSNTPSNVVACSNLLDKIASDRIGVLMEQAQIAANNGQPLQRGPYTIVPSDSVTYNCKALENLRTPLVVEVNPEGKVVKVIPQAASKETLITSEMFQCTVSSALVRAGDQFLTVLGK